MSPIGQLVGQQGYFFYPVNITLAATLNVQGEAFVQVLQGSDFKVICISSVQTGNWSVVWGTNTINFSAPNPSNTFGFCRYSNVFGTGILPHRWIGPGYDFCPIFPRGSLIKFLFRNDTANSNTIELGVEGIYGNWLTP